MRPFLENIYPEVVKSIETIKNTAFESTKDFLEITRIARLETRLEEVITRIIRVILYTMLLNIIHASLMIQEIREISGLNVVGYEDVDVNGDRYFIVELKGSASQVLSKWLEKADELRETSRRLGVKILLRWSGETDLPPERLGEYLGKIFGKQEIFLKTPSRFNAVSLLEKEWET